MAKFSCPSCGNKCSVSKKNAEKGKTLTCPGCGNKFVIKGKKGKPPRDTVIDTSGNLPETQAKVPDNCQDTAVDTVHDSKEHITDPTVIGAPKAVSGGPSRADVSDIPLAGDLDPATDPTVVGAPQAVSDPPDTVASPKRKSVAEGIGEIPDTLVPGFIIKSLLGEGGMGAVYKARQLSLDRTVALKLLAKDLSSVPDFVKRFEKEAKALASLNHPNITSIFDRGVAGGFCYFAMEYVEGITLADKLREKRLSPAGRCIDHA